MTYDIPGIYKRKTGQTATAEQIKQYEGLIAENPDMFTDAALGTGHLESHMARAYGFEQEAEANKGNTTNTSTELRNKTEEELNNLVVKADPYGYESPEEKLKRQEEGFRDDAKDKLSERMSGLEKTMQLEVEKREKEQGGEKGAQRLGLAGKGALGRTISATTPIEKLKKIHDEELGAIRSKYLKMIQAAQSAYETKDFELTKFYTEQANELGQAAIDSELKIAEEERKVAAEERKVVEYEQEQQERSAEFLVSGFSIDDIDAMSYEDINSLAEQYGIDPMTLYGSINTKREAAKKLAMADFKDYWNIAKSLKKGESVTAPDGTVIYGVKVGAITEYFVEAGGLKYKVGADKDTGKELWRNEIGVVKGSSSSTSPEVTPETEPSSFEEFIKAKEEELGMSIAFPEDYMKEYIKQQVGNIYYTKKDDAKNWISQVITNSPNATWDELYTLADITTSLSASDIKSFLKQKGFTEPEKKKTSTSKESEMTDEEFKKMLENVKSGKK